VHRPPADLRESQDAGIAVMTARRALQVVVQEGYAYMRAGMGKPASMWPRAPVGTWPGHRVLVPVRLRPGPGRPPATVTSP
jgi:hypothetical protein